jgi:hypothetical protein
MIKKTDDRKAAAQPKAPKPDALAEAELNAVAAGDCGFGVGDVIYTDVQEDPIYSRQPNPTTRSR